MDEREKNKGEKIDTCRCIRVGPFEFEKVDKLKQLGIMIENQRREAPKLMKE